MSDYTKRLVEERANVWEQAKALLDTADNEARALDGEEKQKYDRFNERMDQIDAQLEQRAELEKRNSRIEESLSTLRNAPKQPTEQRETSENERLRAFFRGEAGRSFEVRASNVSGVDGNIATPGPRGGYTVPTSFHNQLLEHVIEVSAIMQAGVYVLTTAEDGKLYVPKTASYSTASVVGEADAIPQSDPTFAQVTMDAYKYGVMNQISHELIHDSAFDLVGFLARQSGVAIGNKLGADLVNGDGDGKPLGLMHASSGITVGKTGAEDVFAPTIEDLFALYYSIISPHRAKAAWLLKDENMSEIRQLKDGSGRYVFEPALVADAPNTLLGRPVHTDPNMPAWAADAKSLVFGDFSQYWVRRVEGVRFERSDDYAFNTDMVTFRTLLRADGKLVGDVSALKAYKSGPAGV